MFAASETERAGLALAFMVAPRPMVTWLFPPCKASSAQTRSSAMLVRIRSPEAAATTAVGNEIGADRLYGIEGIIGGQAGDSISGNALANWIDGHTGVDTLVGRGGDDTYLVDRLGDVVVEVAAEGTDTVITSVTGIVLAVNVENLELVGNAVRGTGNSADNRVTGNGTANLLFGMDGHDTLVGDLGKVTLDGGAGNDSLDGGAGADAMGGGLGNDSYRVDVGGDVVTETGNGGIDTVRTALAEYDLGANVENLIGLGAAAALTGNGLANLITGGAGNNSLDGGGGDDTLRGGAGDDIYTVVAAGDVVTEVGNNGLDTVCSGLVLYTLGANVENLIALKAAAITGTGNGLANTITGNIGNESLDGGAGQDTMNGGLGNDSYSVDHASDVVTEAAAGGSDTIRTSLSSFTLGTNLENLIALGAAAFSGVGNGLANRLTGGTGNDSLDGKAGSDTMTGGLGDDTYTVDSLTDEVAEALSGGTDTVLVRLTTYTLDSNLERLVGLNTAASTLIGNALANMITGNSGNDTLDGGTGRDTVAGGGLAEILMWWTCRAMLLWKQWAVALIRCRPPLPR